MHKYTPSFTHAYTYTLYMYIYVCICTHIYIYKYMYISHLHMYIYIYSYIYVCACIHVYVYIYVYTYLYICVYTSKHTCDTYVSHRSILISHTKLSEFMSDTTYLTEFVSSTTYSRWSYSRSELIYKWHIRYSEYSYVTQRIWLIGKCHEPFSVLALEFCKTLIHMGQSVTWDMTHAYGTWLMHMGYDSFI